MSSVSRFHHPDVNTYSRIAYICNVNDARQGKWKWNTLSLKMTRVFVMRSRVSIHPSDGMAGSSCYEQMTFNNPKWLICQWLRFSGGNALHMVLARWFFSMTFQQNARCFSHRIRSSGMCSIRACFSQSHYGLRECEVFWGKQHVYFMVELILFIFSVFDCGEWMENGHFLVERLSRKSKINEAENCVLNLI